MTARSIEMFRRMGEHTARACAGNEKCLGKLGKLTRCCEAVYCEIARDWMRDQGLVVPADVPVEDRMDEKVPYLGREGCILPPHCRPICTVHFCLVNDIGCLPGDDAWTRKYFRLRQELDRAASIERVVDSQ